MSQLKQNRDDPALAKPFTTKNRRRINDAPSR